MPEDLWPNFFLTGAAKAGTTSLHRYLHEHPDVFMSPEKETYFFSQRIDETEDDPDALEAATEAYLALFEQAGDARIRGESTPGYLWWPEVPERIQARVPEARFAVSLRDPVQRAYSDHLMHARQGLTDRSFLDRVREELEDLDDRSQGLVTPGLYHRHLERYVDRFGRDRVHAILFDQLKRDPLTVLEGLAGFLGIDESAMAAVDYDTVHNPHGEPVNALARWLKHNPVSRGLARLVLPERLRIHLGEHVLMKKREKPPMEPEARELLVDVFEPEIAALEKLLERDLDPLRASWREPS